MTGEAGDSGIINMEDEDDELSDQVWPQLTFFLQPMLQNLLECEYWVWYSGMI